MQVTPMGAFGVHWVKCQGAERDLLKFMSYMGAYRVDLQLVLCLELF